MLSLPSVCTLYKYMCFTSFLFTETNNESKATWLFSACLRCTTEIMGRFFESIFFAEQKLANELFILHFSSTSQIMCIKKHFVYEPTIFEHQKNWLWNQKRERKKTKPHRKLFPIEKHKIREKSHMHRGEVEVLFDVVHNKYSFCYRKRESTHSTLKKNLWYLPKKCSTSINKK